MSFCVQFSKHFGRVRLGYSGIRIYSGIYSSYSAPGSRIGGMEIQEFRNEYSSQTNAFSHYSNYSYSELISNERVLRLFPRHSVTSQTMVSTLKCFVPFGLGVKL